MDLNGNEIEHDDDDGGNRDSYIKRKLLPGSYLIEVTTYRSGKTGRFTLRLYK